MPLPKMNRWLSACMLLCVSALARGEAPKTGAAAALSARIDTLVSARWAQEKVAPAAPADDAEFLRRIYLDLAGRIPRVAEARAFLADPSADKRARLVERLLAGPLYVKHFTNYWRALLVPETNNPRFLDPNFSAWLGKQLRDNTGYDRMVRELLTTPVVAGNPRMRLPVQAGQPTPLAFYQANENKPENLAAATSRLFLGIRLECAECHDHPFAHHSRKQFWELAAFFAGIRTQNRGNFAFATEDKADVREIKIPGTERVVQARFLDGATPNWQPNATARFTLADWITTEANPYFARAAVNRLWAYFFGIGMIDPVDEMLNDDHTASHPELLDELARTFAANQFDLRFLIRAIVLSRTYQLSSSLPGPAADVRLLQHLPLRALTPEQLFDSLELATGYRAQGVPNQRFGQQAPRTEFLTKFAASGKRTEPRTSILQALTLMNGKFIGDATNAADLERTETLAAVADAPFLDSAGRIDTLFLATLSRHPRPEELSRLARYVDAGGPRHDSRAALADVFWTLLNSTEFIVNH